MKSAVKAKKIKHVAAVHRTGGGSPPSPLALTETEKEILKAVGDYEMCGDDEIMEIGLPVPSTFRFDSKKLKESTAACSAGATPKKRTFYDQREEEEKSFELQKNIIDGLNDASQKLDVLTDLQNQRFAQNSQLLEYFKAIAENLNQNNEE